MNDFTKDELEDLLFFTMVHKNKYEVKYPQELIEKLKSLIDNYCEHKEQKMDCDGGISLVCKLCGTTTMDI